jgi:tail lysozyme
MASNVIPMSTQQIVTSEAPHPALSGADIAQPYESLARGLDKAGQGLEAVAVPLAERAGSEAVTRDAQGNIQVEQMPFMGLAGQAYQRAVKVAALAEADGKAQRDDIALRDKFRDNPEGYVAAAASYKDKQVQDLTAAAGPEVGNAVGRVIDHTTTQTYRGLLNEKERLDLQKADGAITAGVNSASDDAVALARQGAPLDGPDMQALLGKYTTLLDEKLKNPRLAYTQEQHDLDIQQFNGQLAGARNLYHVDDVYKTQGYQPAVEAAKDVLTNPDYKLTPAQRQGFYSHAMGEIRANEAIRHQDIGEAREGLRQLSLARQLGQKISPDEVEAVANGFRAANYSSGVAQTYAAFAHADLHDDFGRGPIAGQTQETMAIAGARASRDAFQFFTGRGYTPEQASGIVGNLAHESDMNPGAVGDSGTSIGLAQFHNERAAALKSYAASVGKPASDFQTQLEFIDKELRGPEAATFAKLQGARTPEEAAAAFINYERPQGYTPQNPAGGAGYQSRQALARSVFQGSAADGSGGPGVQSWLLANRQATLDDSVTKAWKQTWADWDGSKGGTPSKDRMDELINGARASGNIDLLEKINQGAALFDYADRIRALPLNQQAYAETELKRRISMGQPPFAGAELVEKQLTAKTQAIQSGLQSDPVATTVANFPDKLKTPAPLDFTNPQALVAGLKMRGQIAQTGAANWQTGPLSAMDSQEIVAAKAALTNPDPAVKAGIYGAIATLPEDVRGATLKAIGGNEPKALVEVGAGSMMATNPTVAASIFRGQAAIAVDKGYLPTKGTEATAFDQKFSEAIPASTFSLAARTDPAGPFAVASGMVKARYADLSAQSADTTGKLNPERLQRAVDDVTGGILEHNGGKLIAPARGMPQPIFDRTMQGITDADLGNAAPPSNLQAATTALNLNPQEQALYQRHFSNLYGSGGVTNANGSRSTLFQTSFEQDGKAYNVPTVYDGKILSPQEAIDRAMKEGLDKFPSYKSEDEAEARYQQMHDYMEKDTAQYLRGSTAVVTTPHGEPISADYLRNRATLESVGDGTYHVRVGKDPPVYAYQGANSEAPQKFVLDLRNRPLGNQPTDTGITP